LASVGVQLVLYPLSAYRAMSQAAINVYQHILKDGTQQNVLSTMQSRMELYDYLGYHAYEQQLDRLFAEKGAE
jgi:methylisocitrate lyase